MITLTIEIYDQIFEWAKDGTHVGIAANTMLEAVTGKSVYSNSRDIPYDFLDFDRCLELCKTVPIIEQNLNMVAAKYPKWKLIIKKWEFLKDFHSKASHPFFDKEIALLIYY